MTLADGLASRIEELLVRARAAARARMTSSALVQRVDPSNPGTDDDGFEVDGWTAVYPALPSWIDKGRGTRTVRVGDVEMQLAVRVFKAPHDTTLLQDGDVAEMLSGPCAGRFFRFVETTPVDQKKQQEFEVVETDRPGGWT